MRSLTNTVHEPSALPDIALTSVIPGPTAESNLFELCRGAKEEDRRSTPAGDKMYVDYAGDKLHLTLPDGSKQPVEVFVAILGCSQSTYVEATESQRKEDFIGSCENALHFFDGVPQALVTDNLKSAVTKASRYEAVLNEDFASLTDEKRLVRFPPSCGA